MSYLLCIGATVIVMFFLFGLINGLSKQSRREEYMEGYDKGYEDGLRDLENSRLSSLKKIEAFEKREADCIKREFVIGTLSNAKMVAQVASKFAEDIDIVKNHYTINAKSIMGILSLDISKPVNIRIHTTDEQKAETLFVALEENMC